MLRFHVPRALISPALFGAMLAGCGDSDLSEIVDKVKESAAETAESVKESTGEITEQVQETVTENAGEATDQVQQQLDLAGRFELTLDQPVTVKGCYVRFFAFTSERPSVLQLRSYGAVERETFPSVFVRAIVAANSVDEIVGETVEAQLYAQTEEDGPVWYCDANSLVKLKIASLEDKTITGEFRGSILNSATGDRSETTGRFEGMLE